MKLSTSDWIVAHSSVSGLRNNCDDDRCQDIHKVQFLSRNVGIVVIADGASSSINSRLGANFVVEKACELFSKLITQKSWLIEDLIPTQKEWQIESGNCLQKIRDLLKVEAQVLDLNYYSLSSTIIVNVFSSKCILNCHIGDGRSGYMNRSKIWEDSMVPFKGDQIGETIFINTEVVFQTPEEYIGTNVVEDQIQAIIIASDGCENICFNTLQKCMDEDFYIDVNKPFSPFLNHNIEVLAKMNKEKYPTSKITRLWKDFLKSGNDALSNEIDDKTMVLAINKSILHED